MVREFEPRIGLCTDSSEPGDCFRFCVTLSLYPLPAHTLSLSLSISLSLSLSKINIKEDGRGGEGGKGEEEETKEVFCSTPTLSTLLTFCSGSQPKAQV